jgi:predicted phosphohydrolase
MNARTPMKIHLASDYHNEFGRFQEQAPDAELLILAGDVDHGIEGARWAIGHFPGMQIIYVAGNHEYYGGNKDHLAARLNALSRARAGFHFLDNRTVILGHLRIIGCTLWPDFRILGAAHFREACRTAAPMVENKFLVCGQDNGQLRPVTVRDLVRFNLQSVRFLERELARAFAGPTIVVTHYAPSLQSVPGHKRSSLGAAREGCDLEWLIRKHSDAIALWVHGHTHYNVDYMIGSTRIVSNQRGYYPGKLLPDFHASLNVVPNEPARYHGKGFHPASCPFFSVRATD